MNFLAHSNIEKTVKKRTLYPPDQWKTAIQLSFQGGKVVVNSLLTKDVLDFKSTESFPEYQALLKDTTTQDDEIVKNKKHGKIYWR